ncbi:MAG: secretin and TonB N-terminal domain-containing protein [Endomicrobium sp.]|jgi:type IV pilus assembly protein PilQ|nr:secretin and TonB N-terminal domain-containing protein [Endomicrobium sp.]
MKKFLVLLISVVILSETAFAAIESRGLISVDFQGTTLYTVLNILSMKTGRKFVTDADLLNKKIVLSLKDVTPDEALNALLDTYDLYYVKQGDTNIYVIKSKSDVSPITVSKVIFCNYAKALDLEKVLHARLSKGGKIASDERTNSIIITDLADSIDKMENLIRSLDVPTPQVLIEARIVDVNIGSNLQIGTQIEDIFRMPRAYQNGAGKWTIDSNGHAWIDPVSIMGEDNIPMQSARYTTEYSQYLSLPPVVGTGRLATAIVAGEWNILGNIFMGLEEKDAKILTNPKLIVLNNQEATIEIIEEIPYQSDRIIDSETTAIMATTSFKEVGLKLKVKPQINRDGTIVLQVQPEQSFRTGEAIEGTPVINTSKAETIMMLRSGETAVIGGLIRETETKTENKIPLLGDIPILGYLFKSVVKNKVRYELTIFISAKIIN